MATQALEDLFVQELEEMYDAEKQIYKGLAEMQGLAHNAELSTAFETHRKQTKQQIQRLEKAFQILGEKPSRGKSSGVSGLIRDTHALAAKDVLDPAVSDAALITCGQKIEHYEIAAYGCIRTHANLLGYQEIADLVKQSLSEEQQTDALLTQIAETSVNDRAAAAPYAQARTGLRHQTARAAADASPDGGKLSLGKLALGVAVGGAISVLFAPKSGAETRRQIKEQFQGVTGSSNL